MQNRLNKKLNQIPNSLQTEIIWGGLKI